MPPETSKVTIGRDLLQDMLAASLTKEVIDNPEQRDELVKSLIRSVLDSKEYSSDKLTYMEKYIRYGIGEEVKKIAQDWVKKNKKDIERQVDEAMRAGAVKTLVAAIGQSISDRITRGY